MSLDDRSRYIILQITNFETDHRNRLNANTERKRPTNTGTDFNANNAGCTNEGRNNNNVNMLTEYNWTGTDKTC